MMADEVGFELATSGVTGRRSNYPLVTQRHAVFWTH